MPAAIRKPPRRTRLFVATRTWRARGASAAKRSKKLIRPRAPFVAPCGCWRLSGELEVRLARRRHRPPRTMGHGVFPLLGAQQPFGPRAHEFIAGERRSVEPLTARQLSNQAAGHDMESVPRSCTSGSEFARGALRAPAVEQRASDPVISTPALSRSRWGRNTHTETNIVAPVAGRAAATAGAAAAEAGAAPRPATNHPRGGWRFIFIIEPVCTPLQNVARHVLHAIG